MRLGPALPSFLAALLVAGACSSSGPPGRPLGGLLQSDWRFEGAEPHPALRPGVELARWTLGSGDDRRTQHALRVAGADVSVGDAADLLPHVRPLDRADAAVAYTDLVRRLAVPGLPGGTPLAPDATQTGRGANGVYTPKDAAAWGIALEPTTEPSGGGILVSRVVLLPPVRHEVLRHSSPWRVVLRREVVFPDGTIRGVDERTLSNGSDAERYARF